MNADNLLDLLVLSEPLACVMHAHAKLPLGFAPKRILVVGAGPIGALHLLELRERFPEAELSVVEPVESRRKLLAERFSVLNLMENLSSDEFFDLIVVATSAVEANLRAANALFPGGVLLLFSGLDLRSGDTPPVLRGVDLERVHRNEESVMAEGGRRFVGSSGYHPLEIEKAAQRILSRPDLFQRLQTRVLSGFFAEENGYAGIDDLLNEHTLSTQDLKIVFRMGSREENLCVTPDGSLQRARIQQASSRGRLKAGLVRVKMLRVSLCQTDRRVLQGTKHANLHPDMILGHEGVGVVMGADRPELLGQLVVVLPHHFNEKDRFQELGLGYLSRTMEHLGVHRDGIFAGYVDLPVDCVCALQLREVSHVAA